MSKKILMKGNEAIAEAAIRAGCRYYFAYPITPQNEIPAYMAKRLAEVGGTFLQAESEIAAINMVIGAAAAGARAMTSSSSPGIALKQEGMSSLSGDRLPAVVVSMMRGGPGLGNIAGSQGDYFQATRGGGNGDYHIVVIAPGTVQELADLTVKAFEIADRYRVVAMILGDGYLGQMAEPCILPDDVKDIPAKPWAVTGKTPERDAHIIASLKLTKDDTELCRHVRELEKVYKEIAARETIAESYLCDDADVVICAYGTASRVCRKAVTLLREEGVRAGLFRPITLWPFPEAEIEAACANAKKVLAVEMSLGQMVQDVRLCCGKPKSQIDFYGEPAGVIPKLDVIMEKVKSYV